MLFMGIFSHFIHELVRTGCLSALAKGTNHVLQDTSRHDALVNDHGWTDLEIDDLRSIIRESTSLSPMVFEASFFQVFDRVLDDTTIAALTDPSTFPQEESEEQCRRRKKALVPYFGRRLICVLINLPGVIYTVEIDPFLERVIHWERVAT